LYWSLNRRAGGAAQVIDYLDRLAKPAERRVAVRHAVAGILHRSVHGEDSLITAAVEIGAGEGQAG
jgi:hypothetical protein